MIRCRATLRRPAGGRGSWTFLVLPQAASAKLPARSATTVEGTLNGSRFRATLEPDGRRSHWLKVSRRMRELARAEPGEIVRLEIRPAAVQLEARVPPDLSRALAAAPGAHEVWRSLSTVARRDWVQWVVSARQPGTRARRVASACSMLASGKRRVCCFDRSGIYGGHACAPDAAD